ncbi:HlyD family secretion protein [Gimesia chilikensis]|uniref:HlyD family secretion protein n=1 Tax=Gimesia chilikensis TaxID=2605989 RepID=UPI00118C583E|nr:HlyD family efflux transporter periplasmic adaptor subunit [Gimesia chilikensis]MCR9233976.1 HlyD family efflux transporter periplasmic adaptor subunit [bacterium]QDT88026.1 HlyD family secretion protein [Gimesia chilikensis]
MTAETIDDYQVQHHLNEHHSSLGFRALVILMIALVGGVSCAQWVRGLRVDSYVGSLQAPKTIVTARTDAVIQKMHVAEGQTVDSEDIVVTLFDRSLEKTWQVKQQQLAALEAELEQSKAKTEVELALRNKEIESEVFQAKLKSSQYLKEQYIHQITNLAWQDFLQDYDSISSSGSNEEVFRSLVYESRLPDENRITAMLRQESARNSAEVFAARVKLCEEQMAELKALQRKLPQQIRLAMGVEVIKNRLEQVKNELKQLETQREDLQLRAGRYGTVGMLEKEVGDTIQKGAPILELFDKDHPYLLVEVPSRKISLFEEGTQVKILFSGDLKGKGVVRKISEQAVRKTGSSESLILVHVEPAGPLWPELPMGTTVDISLEK